MKNKIMKSFAEVSSTCESGDLHCYNQSVYVTPEIEKKFVHGVYDAIAPHFSSTRFAKWPKVVSFLQSMTPGSVVVDCGCGNGKYLDMNSKCIFVGCDISPSLISICKEKGNEVLVADALNLPFRTDFCDAAISIAVLHHLSTEQRRNKAVVELARVIRKGGKALITVWAVEQEDRSLLEKWTPLTHKYTEEWVGSIITPRLRSNSISGSLRNIEENDTLKIASQDTLKKPKQEESDSIEARCDRKSSTMKSEKEQQEYFVPWYLPYHRAEIANASTNAAVTGLGRKDDIKGAIVYNRYYHVFVEGELERLVSGVDGLIIVDRFYDKSNWCVIVEKL